MRRSWSFGRRRGTVAIASALALAACADIFGIPEYRTGSAHSGGRAGGGGAGIAASAGMGGESAMSQAGEAGASAAGEGGTAAGIGGGDAGVGAGAGQAGSGASGGAAGTVGISGGSGIGGSMGGTGDSGAGGSTGGTGGIGGAGSAGVGPCGPPDAEWSFDNGSPSGWDLAYGEPPEVYDDSFVEVDEAAGTFKITAAFNAAYTTDAQDQIVYLADDSYEDPRDYTDKILFACVRLQQKLDASPGNPRATLFVETGQARTTARGNSTILDASGGWKTLRLDVWDPAQVDMGGDVHQQNDIRAVGMEIETGLTGSYGPVVVAMGAAWLEDR